MSKDRDFYKQGYETGSEWESDYRPGGPYVCTNKKDMPDICKQDRKNRRNWFLGFDDALVTKQEAAEQELKRVRKCLSLSRRTKGVKI